MLWFFRRLLDRLYVRVTGTIASQIESHLQMELSETQAGLLRRAKELEHEDTPGMEQVVSDLRSRAERIGLQIGPDPEVVRYVSEIQKENLRDIDSLRLPSPEEPKPQAIESPNGRQRPRSKKGASSDSELA